MGLERVYKASFFVPKADLACNCDATWHHRGADQLKPVRY